jgi:hypothetical protein
VIGLVFGKKVVYQHIPNEVFMSSATGSGVPEKVATELMEMMKYFEDYGCESTFL